MKRPSITVILLASNVKIASHAALKNSGEAKIIADAAVRFDLEFYGDQEHKYS